MPLNLLLSSAIDYELSHQLLLKHLLENPEFLKLISGIQETDYKVELEPKKGKFDMGIWNLKESRWSLMIELKMWSPLSAAQLQSQTEFLTENQIPGLHILLGTADICYYQKGNFDQIAHDSQNHSRKAGYIELIGSLKNFIGQNDASQLTELAKSYLYALEYQYQQLMNCWQNPLRKTHKSYYSLYHQIRQHLPGRGFPIKSVNNAAGGAIILGDNASWTSFSFQNQAFQAYHEILNGCYMIRIWSETANNAQRHAVRARFVEAFRKLDDTGVLWNHNFKCSIWHKILTHQPQYLNKDDLQSVARLMQYVRPLIKKAVENAFQTDHGIQIP